MHGLSVGSDLAHKSLDLPKHFFLWKAFKKFQPGVAYLHPLKTSENL